MGFEDRLKEKGLLPGTRKKYAEILSGVRNEDLLDWVQHKVTASTPLGTVLPMRAAVKHYLIAEHGYSADELDALLPKAKGKETALREPLTPEELALYHAALHELQAEPAKTILTLLPASGLLISEACTLRREHLVGDELVLDETRRIPVLPAGLRALRSYIEKENPQSWLFVGRANHPITAHAVRVYLRALRERHTSLGSSLTPYVLRHTYAVILLRRGMSFEDVQKILGHEHVATTRRYADALR